MIVGLSSWSVNWSDWPIDRVGSAVVMQKRSRFFKICVEFKLASLMFPTKIAVKPPYRFVVAKFLAQKEDTDTRSRSNGFLFLVDYYDYYCDYQQEID
jgi:stalled ribosome rescue protein Dom34